MRALLITLTTLLLLVACGPGELGQDCQGGPAENDCVDGALCTAEPADEHEVPESPTTRHVCRAICDNNADCTEEGFVCLRAEGTMLSACQPDPTAPPPAED